MLDERTRRVALSLRCARCGEPLEAGGDVLARVVLPHYERWFRRWSHESQRLAR